MEERLRFVARLLDGENMTDVCREFGISRKTGYKIFDRYKEHGLAALTDRSRRPVRYANQLPAQVETLIVCLKGEKPHWGARKIRELLVRRLSGDVRVPARSTIHAVLDRHGLVKRGGGPRQRARGTPLSAGAAPNDLWCADFKGEFKLGNGRYCYPLTVTDHASRFLLLCEALESNREDTAFTAFERLFAERGMPLAIRSDNGVPFASPNALFNLSKLAVWWLRLGIAIERIKPGRPQQNGRHERMHLTLKKEATRPPGGNSLQQQARFDTFMHEFNTERPHEARAMKCPAELYAASPRRYKRPARVRLSVPRPRHPRHRLRTHLPAPQENQHLHRVRRPTEAGLARFDQAHRTRRTSEKSRRVKPRGTVSVGVNQAMAAQRPRRHSHSASKLFQIRRGHCLRLVNP
jgi:transposase InsO family protein